MRAHVAHLADPEVPVHIPEQAVHTVRTTEILRAVRMIGRGADPLFVMQRRGRHTLAFRVSWPWEFAGIPAMNGLQVADGAIQNQFPDALEVGIGVTLRAMLRSDLDFIL